MFLIKIYRRRLICIANAYVRAFMSLLFDTI